MQPSPDYAALRPCASTTPIWRSAWPASCATLYLNCCDESERRVLGFEEAARCSIAAAEVLKRRSFGGDFGAMLAWWRLQRGGTPAARTTVGH
ncbi:MAG TPA: hypothetical protein VIW70_08205 [Rubrivivax sp.]